MSAQHTPIMLQQPVLGKQFFYAVERAVQILEAQADAIDRANPNDPYASLMVREDIATLREGLAVRSTS